MTSRRPIAAAAAWWAVVAAGAAARADDGGATPPVEPADPPPAQAPPAETPATETGATEPPPDGDPRPPTGRFEVGAGYSTDLGFIGRAAVIQDDLFGTGQRLALSAELSARHADVDLRHEVPELLGSGLNVRSELFAHRHQLTGFAVERAGGAVTVGRALGAATRITLGYRVEHVGIELDGGPPPPDVGRAPVGSGPEGTASTELGDGVLASLSAGLVHDTLDVPWLPRRGTRVALSATVADRRLGSDHELVRLDGGIDHARALGPLTLRVSGRAAYVRSRDPGGVPLAERLQHDGHDEVRGYPIGSIGPTAWRDGHRFIAGDNLEASGRVELELPVWRRAGLSIVGFADAGARYNADAGWGPTGAGLHRSVGFGIVWRSPIGLLRFDWAVPLDGEDRAPRFLFSLGGGW